MPVTACIICRTISTRSINGTPAFKTFYDADPPYHQHTLWDHCEMPGRYLYGIVFARQLIGPDEIKDAEKKIKKNLYRQFDCPDGLCHRRR